MTATQQFDSILESFSAIRQANHQDNAALVRCLMNGGSFTLSWYETCRLLDYVQGFCKVEFLEKPLNAWNAPGKSGTIIARPVRVEYDYRIKRDAQVFCFSYEKK